MSKSIFCVGLCLLTIILGSGPLQAKGPVYTNPEKADADFAYQGEYSGQLKTNDGELKIAVQVIALGKGQFRAVAHVGGLPGDGWNAEEKKSVDGKLEDGKVVFQGDGGSGVLQNGTITIITKDGVTLGDLPKVVRQSPTLGQKAPKGAVVLFDGTTADKFKGGKLDDAGNLMQGVTSKQTFGSHTLHLEFRLPYMPEDRGQARGNSGIYLQGRYETQMLDSFGLEGKDNECGGLYSVKAPDLNMCFPPLSWQTYDIDYTEPKFDDAGKLTANPRVTVRHNGVIIHNDVELPGERSTTAAPIKPGPGKGPIYLQNHGNPVRYRNIWLVEK